MLKKIIVTILIGLTANLYTLADGGKTENEFADKVKSEVAKLGVGPDARIKVKLKDGTKVKGYKVNPIV